MKIRDPIPHWSNFTIPELKRILKHCAALDKLGIAQDEQMMTSIQRDIDLRQKRMVRHVVNSDSTSVEAKQKFAKRISKSDKITSRYETRPPKENLLEQIVS